MSVEGNEQRIYGVVRGDCYIDLHRFACVFGSMTEDPSIHVGTVAYGDDEKHGNAKPCSDAKGGNLTITFEEIIYSHNINIKIEVLLCENGTQIDVWSYGVLAFSGYTSLWYNSGTRDAPIWNKLNSAAYNVLMPEASTSFDFSGEVLSDDEVYLVTCCDEVDSGCNACKCFSCNITSRFYVLRVYNNTKIVGTLYDYSFHNYGEKTLAFALSVPVRCDETYEVYYIDDNSIHHKLATYDIGVFAYYNSSIFIEYSLNCEAINIWTYPTEFPDLSFLNIKIASICCDSVTLVDGTCAFTFGVGQPVYIQRGYPDYLAFTFGNVERVDGNRIFINNIHNDSNPILNYDRSVWTPLCCGGTSTSGPSGQTYAWQSILLTGMGSSAHVYCSFDYEINLTGVMYEWYWGNSMCGIGTICTSGWKGAVVSLSKSGIVRNFKGHTSFSVNAADPYGPENAASDRRTFGIYVIAGCDAFTTTISNLQFTGCPAQNYGCDDEFRCLPVFNSYLGSWEFFLRFG